MIRHRRTIFALLASLALLTLAGCQFPGAGVSVSFTSPAEGARITGVSHPGTVTVTVAVSGYTGGSFQLTSNGSPVPTVSPTAEGYQVTDVPLLAGDNVLVATLQAGAVSYSATRHVYYRQAANLVMGQSGMTTSVPQASQQRLNRPSGTAGIIAGAQVYIPDTQNNRVVGYSSMPSTNGATFLYLLGQTDFAASAAETFGASALSTPTAVADANGKLVVADEGHSRVLIWSGAPTTTNAPASVSVGQASPTTSPQALCDASHLNHPEGVFVKNGKLIVADTENNRVLVWNTVPLTSGTSADLVLGQADATHCSANRGSGVNANTLDAPTGVWSDGTRLVVADTGNNRVLIWNAFPTQNGAAAGTVVGQASMNDGSAHAADDASPTAAVGTGLSAPSSVSGSNNQLFVADTGHNRVVIFDPIPTSNGARASQVLGQADLTGTGSNADGLSASSLAAPEGVRAFGSFVIVADTGNSRELRYQW